MAGGDAAPWEAGGLRAAAEPFARRLGGRVTHVIAAQGHPALLGTLLPLFPGATQATVEGLLFGADRAQTRRAVTAVRGALRAAPGVRRLMLANCLGVDGDVVARLGERHADQGGAVQVHVVRRAGFEQLAW